MGVNCDLSERGAILMFGECPYDTERASLVGVAWPRITIADEVCLGLLGLSTTRTCLNVG